MTTHQRYQTRRLSNICTMTEIRLLITRLRGDQKRRAQGIYDDMKRMEEQLHG